MSLFQGMKLTHTGSSSFNQAKNRTDELDPKDKEADVEKQVQQSQNIASSTEQEEILDPFAAGDFQTESTFDSHLETLSAIILPDPALQATKKEGCDDATSPLLPTESSSFCFIDEFSNEEFEDSDDKSCRKEKRVSEIPVDSTLPRIEMDASLLDEKFQRLYLEIHNFREELVKRVLLHTIDKYKEVKKLSEEQDKAVISEDYEKAEELSRGYDDRQQELKQFTLQLVDIEKGLESSQNDVVAILNKSLEHNRNSVEKLEQLKNKYLEEWKLKEKEQNEYMNTIQSKNDKEQNQLERGLGHLSLDKNHLKDAEERLHARVDEKCTEFYQKKDKLLEDKIVVQVRIKELEQQLERLRFEEKEIASQISKEDANIALVQAEFSSEFAKIEEDRETITTQETLLSILDEKIQAEEGKMANSQVSFRQLEKILNENVDQLQKKILTYQEKTGQLETNSERVLSLPGKFLAGFANKDIVKLQENFNKVSIDLQEKTRYLVKSQTSVSTLKKKIDGIESQIETLNESKQLAVSGRNFSEAKQLSEQIKRLIEEGKDLQKTLDLAKTENRKFSEVMTLLKQEVESLQKNLKTQEYENDMRIKEQAQVALESVRLGDPLSCKGKLTVEEVCWAFSDLCHYLIYIVCFKHGLEIPTETYSLVEKYLNTSDITVAKEVKLEGQNEKICSLEVELQKAIEEEDYDKADIFYCDHLNTKTD